MTELQPNVVSVLAGLQHLVKVATIEAAFEARGVRHLTLDTGSRSFPHGRLLSHDLGLRQPDLELRLPTFGSTARAARAAHDRALLQAALRSMNAHVVLVYGDLAGSVDAAVAATELGHFVVHVEAGRRSRDPRDPEEDNRLALDQLADQLLAPSAEALSNLRAEGRGACAEVVGSTAAERFSQAVQASETRGDTGTDVLMAFHRHDTVTETSRMAAIRAVAEELARLGLRITLLTYSDTSRQDRFSGLRDWKSINQVQRLRFSDYVSVLMAASFVVTDSTGIQDDAYSIGTPTITMRTHTHCVESVAGGTNTVVGFDPHLAMSRIREILGGGNEARELKRDLLYLDGAGSRVASAVAISAGNHIRGN